MADNNGKAKREEERDCAVNAKRKNQGAVGDENEFLIIKMDELREIGSVSQVCWYPKQIALLGLIPNVSVGTHARQQCNLIVRES